MEPYMPRRPRVITRNDKKQLEQEERLLSCKEAGMLWAQGVFSSYEQACVHFSISSECHRLIRYHMQQHAARLQDKTKNTTVLDFQHCSVPRCTNRGCPCTGSEENASSGEEEHCAGWTETAWKFAQSMFSDRALSCQDIADAVEKEHGIKRPRQAYQRWRAKKQKLMPRMGCPTRLPPTAESKLIETVAWLRSKRVQIAPMHLAMLAWTLQSQMCAATGRDPGERGFTRQWVYSFCNRHKEKLGICSAEIIEDLRLHACTAKKLERHFDIVADALLELGWARVNPAFDEKVPFDQSNPNDPRCLKIFIDATKAARIASMDETRFTLNQAKEGKLVGGTKKTLFMKGDSLTGADKDWGEVARNKSACDCTIVGGSTCSGNALPALYVFKGGFHAETDLANGPSTRRADGMTMECRGIANDKGSMTDEVMLEWLDKCFAPFFTDLSPENPVLLICDGYGSHLHKDFIVRCAQLGVWVILRPPHTSHVTQGEDIQGGHFQVFHREERIEKAKLKSALEVSPRRFNGNRDSQLRRSDIMHITKKAWEKAFAFDVCTFAWQRIGIYPLFTRRPYWDQYRQEEAHPARNPTADEIAIQEAAAAAVQPEDIGRQWLAAEEEEEDAGRRKRINCSTRWALRGVITHGEALEARLEEERQRETEERTKEAARQRRDEAASARRAEDASAGGQVHECLLRSELTLEQLSKRQVRCLMVFWGQKLIAETKPLLDHHYALMNFLASRQDLPYSPRSLDIASAAAAPELPPERLAQN